MTTAILCPGPSLLKTFSGHKGLTIGVNRAATVFSCDIWAALDFPLIVSQRQHVLGTSAVMTCRETRRSLECRKIQYSWHIVEDLFDYCPHSMRYCGFSATSALILAAKLGATQINVYGADWTDAPDFDGYSHPGMTRNETRWNNERKIWGDVSQWLADRGVTVKRINGTA